MKRIPRDPIRFDLFNAYDAYGRKEALSLTDANAQESFVGQVRASITDGLQNPAFLHGQRTEAMFEALVASLGQFRLLKREDTANAYASEECIEIPDFRIVLPDFSQWLIEVKNFYQGSKPFSNFALKTKYLKGLRRYAKLMGCPLKVAIYWARWNLWSLVSPEVFTVEGDRVAISLGNALQASEMVSLGDISIATQFPLRLRLIADKTKPREITEDGMAQFTTAEVKLFCKDGEITDPVERRIATMLMFFGEWRFDDPKAIRVNGELEGIECQWTPREDHDQGFEIVGSLSNMFSTFYAWNTLDEGRVVKLQTEAVPGYLGNLIPKGYKGQALPLWRFRIQPSSPEEIIRPEEDA